MTDKPKIHLTGPASGVVHLQSSSTICGKQIGATNGYIEVKDYIGEAVCTEPSPYKYYVHLTKTGKSFLKAVNTTRWAGFYSCFLAPKEFEVCPECENSTQVGLEALFYI